MKPKRVCNSAARHPSNDAGTLCLDPALARRPHHFFISINSFRFVFFFFFSISLAAVAVVVGVVVDTSTHGRAHRCEYDYWIKSEWTSSSSSLLILYTHSLYYVQLTINGLSFSHFLRWIDFLRIVFYLFRRHSALPRIRKPSNEKNRLRMNGEKKIEREKKKFTFSRRRTDERRSHTRIHSFRIHTHARPTHRPHPTIARSAGDGERERDG